MRYLFATYIKLNDQAGHSAIGAFTRCQRIAMAMKHRGHEVWMSCAGRHLYWNELMRAATQALPFIDLEAAKYDDPPAALRLKRRATLEAMKLDVLILGEAPVNGMLLDLVICAVSLGIRVVILDNAYNPRAAEMLLCQHAAIADAVVLVGLPTSHPTNAPSHYLASPPLIDQSPDGGQKILAELGLLSDPLIAVLAYDKKAEELAIAILNALTEVTFHSIFVTLDVRRSFLALASLPRPLQRNARVICPREHRTVFDLLQKARLVIGKCGYMQIAESLALTTPFVGLYYPGCFRPTLLPAEAAPFVHTTESVVPDRPTIDAVRKFLRLRPENLKAMNAGEGPSLSKIADFLERLPILPRSESIHEAAEAGYTKDVICQALGVLYGREDVQLQRVCWSRLRNARWGTIDQLVCNYQKGLRSGTASLWGISLTGHDGETCAAAEAAQRRRAGRVLYQTADGRRFIEEDTGTSRLRPEAAWQG